MREILFRAKRKDNGEWTEGYVFELQPGQYMICDRIQYDRPSTLPVWEFFRYCTHEIVPETLCQYTGLTDKNGNRIWENDIVRTTKFGKDDGNGHNYAGFDVFVVKWDDGGFALFNKWRRFNLRTDEKSYEILGKVFDNPELLKGE